MDLNGNSRGFQLAWISTEMSQPTNPVMSVGVTLKRAREFDPAVDVEERLTAMRRRLPEKIPKDTHLQGLIAELKGLLSLHADEPACEGLRCGNCRHGGLRSGCHGLRKTVVCGVEQTVGLLRNECIRVHGLDVWQVPEVKSAIEVMMVEFYQQILRHNLTVCFEALEKHVDNGLKLRTKESISTKLQSGEWVSGMEDVHVSVVEFEKRWGRMGMNMGYDRDGKNYVPVEFQLPGYKIDGIEWGVKIVTIASSDREKYFAIDAGETELEGHTPPKEKMLGFVQYVNTCLHWPRVHRAESLYDAIYGVFEEHIRRLHSAILSPMELQEVLSRLF